MRHWGAKMITPTTPDVSPNLRIAAIAARSCFILALVPFIWIVAWPQSETISTVYESPGDLVRLLFGMAASLWVVGQLFAFPKDAAAYRTWVCVGLLLVPLQLILILALLRT
jgi:hypothetical protein